MTSTNFGTANLELLASVALGLVGQQVQEGMNEQPQGMKGIEQHEQDEAMEQEAHGEEQTEDGIPEGVDEEDDEDDEDDDEEETEEEREAKYGLKEEDKSWKALWVMEKILEKKQSEDGKLLYAVQWRCLSIPDYDWWPYKKDFNPTWEPADKDGLEELIKKFEEEEEGQGPSTSNSG